MAKAKDKIEALDPVDEQPYTVPANWRWVRLGSAYEINPKNIAEDDTEAAFVPMEKISPGMDDLFSFEVQSWAKAKKGHTQFADGDVAFAKISPCFENHKSMTINGLPNGIGGGTTELIILRQKKINQKYTYWLINTEQFIKGGCATYSGTVGQQRISMDYVRNFPVPLPPYSEQIRIVARIESLFAKLDEAKEKAQAVVDGYEDRKAAILHKAFMGELTEKWRKERGVSFNTWKKYDLKECCSIGSGGTPSRKESQYYEGNIPWIKTGEINWNYIYDSEEHISESAVANSSAKIYPAGSVLVAMYGMGVTRGRASILNISAATNQAVCVLCPCESLINRYLFYFFMENYWRIREQAVGGNQLNLSATIIGKLRIDIPLIEEQKEIINILDKLLEQESQAKETAEQIVEYVNAMKKSILAKAFRGKLGTNDPSEEPVAL